MRSLMSSLFTPSSPLLRFQPPDRSHSFTPPESDDNNTRLEHDAYNALQTFHEYNIHWPIPDDHLSSDPVTTLPSVPTSWDTTTPAYNSTPQCSMIYVPVVSPPSATGPTRTGSQETAHDSTTDDANLLWTNKFLSNCRFNLATLCGDLRCRFCNKAANTHDSKQRKEMFHCLNFVNGKSVISLSECTQRTCGTFFCHICDAIIVGKTNSNIFQHLETKQHFENVKPHHDVLKNLPHREFLLLIGTTPKGERKKRKRDKDSSSTEGALSNTPRTTAVVHNSEHLPGLTIHDPRYTSG